MMNFAYVCITIIAVLGPFFILDVIDRWKRGKENG